MEVLGEDDEFDFGYFQLELIVESLHEEILW